MKTLPKIASLLLISAFVIAGCGSQEAGNTKQTTTAAETTTTTETTTEATADEAQTETAAQTEGKADTGAEADIADDSSEETVYSNADLLSQLVPWASNNQAEMNSVTYDYITKNVQWFPAKSVEDKKAARASADKSVTTRHIFKNITPYLDTMVKISGRVVQIGEDSSSGYTLAKIHILDDNGNSVIGIFLGSTGSILDGDTVTLTGVPTALYSFDNVGGGTTNAIFLSVATVQKP
ncbi:hypothetical protein [Paenibacillus jiagnxiensis]|uniref:hypothetical protein n=1 Tax=Paenibacillus jiagnxiensis TaxID=3228926 RepID=UPI0033AA3C6A